jgi:hypothetical protein
VVGEAKASRRQTVVVWVALLAILAVVMLPLLLIGLKGGWLAGLAAAEVAHPYLKRKVAGVQTPGSKVRDSRTKACAFAAAFIIFNLGWIVVYGSL